jgi:hypothetical protein
MRIQPSTLRPAVYRLALKRRYPIPANPTSLRKH